MIRVRLAVCIALAVLAGCGEQRSENRADRVRIDLGSVSANSRQIADAPAPTLLEPAVWSYAQASPVARYGPIGGPALLAISCEGWAQHAARLVIVRYAVADRGALALFAIQGSKGILRLPVNAVQVGQQGYVWRGILDAADPRTEVLLGAGLKGTVPGGGELDLPPMGAAGAVVSECVLRQTQYKRTTAGQILPNLASNPETSPADR